MTYVFIFSLLYLTLISLVYFSKKRIDNLDNKLYTQAIIGNIIGICIDITQVLLVRTGNSGIALYIVNKIFLCYIILWSLTFTHYVLTISIEKSNLTAVKRIIMLISVIIVMILPIEIETENSAYTYGLAVNYTYVIVFSLIAVMFIVSLRSIIFKNKDIKKYTPLFSFAILGGIATTMQMNNPELLLTTPVEAFITIMTYFFIENPDMKMVEQLEIAKESADKANQAKTDFLSNMSHEIRTPLNAIVGFSEALKYDDLSEDSMEKVNDILMASNNLLEIVNGVLDISKIEANKLEIIDKEYDTKSVIEELVALSKARIGDKGLDFRVYIDPSLPSILYGDNTRIKQVVLNLLTNAIKYTKEGFVEFKVNTVQKDNICRLIFTVEDSGIGIKEESLPKLFSKFDRLGVEKEMTIEGTGLGLAITKRLVDLMGGKIVVQSVYGQGSKFTVSIDQRIIAMKEPALKETKYSESKVINVKGTKCLIVDDNALNIKVASTLLKKYGFEIESASNGLECISKVNKPNEYKIIFLDDMMPHMSGRETIKRLKNNPEFKIPVIALTANAIDGMKEEYLSLGFDDYLSKPIEKNELERVIKKFIHANNIQDSNTTISNNAESIIDMDFELPALSMDVVKKATLPPREEHVPKHEENLADYTGKKVLLVDDNEMNLKVAEMILKKYNLTVEKCSRGKDAIDKVIMNNNYDLILLDEMMPEMDGCTTLDNLKGIEGFEIPTVMMTASPKDEVANKIEEHGFNGYVGKPINKEELDKTLSTLLNK